MRTTPRSNVCKWNVFVIWMIFNYDFDEYIWKQTHLKEKLLLYLSSYPVRWQKVWHDPWLVADEDRVSDVFSHVEWSSLSCRSASTGFPDTLSQPVSIVHRSREVFKATSCIGTEQLYIGSSWSSCLCSSMWRCMSLMSSSLLLQQCPTCLVRLTWIVFVMGGMWPYSCCLVGCCLQGLFNIARSILV